MHALNRRRPMSPSRRWWHGHRFGRPAPRSRMHCRSASLPSSRNAHSTGPIWQAEASSPVVAKGWTRQDASQNRSMDISEKPCRHRRAAWPLEPSRWRGLRPRGHCKGCRGSSPRKRLSRLRRHAGERCRSSRSNRRSRVRCSANWPRWWPKARSPPFFSPMTLARRSVPPTVFSCCRPGLCR